MELRIPVLFQLSSDTNGARIAWLVEGEAQAPSVIHERFGPANIASALSCRCCVPRTDAAAALSRLFMRRARGEVPWFVQVGLVSTSAAGRQAVRAALSTDSLVAARFEARAEGTLE